MQSEALQVVVKHIMKTHVYKFGDKIKKQTQGGPIGLELTGDLAQVFMMWYDSQLRSKLEERGIKVLMYQRYVDDINMVMERPKENVLPKREEMDTKDDTRTMQIVKEIGDSIHSSMRLDTDTPSQHEDQKLPILDLKVWIEKILRINKDENNGGRENNKEETYIVLHEFYSKEMSTKSVINVRSAMPMKMKRTVLTQEVLRVLLRCSPELGWKKTAEHASN